MIGCGERKSWVAMPRCSLGQGEKLMAIDFDSVEECLAALKRGEIIVVTDDEDRENEGDCICAAEFATTANVNFMASYAKGLICMPMSRSWCEKLELPQIVSINSDNH